MRRALLTIATVLAGASLSTGDLAGRQLLVISMCTGDTELLIVDPETDDARNLSRSPGSAERYASWSPDGSRVAFTRKLEKGHCLFAMDVGTREVHRLTFRENEFAGVHATWSPDGKRIIYADRVGEALEIFAIDPDGKDVRQRSAQDRGAALGPSPFPDSDAAGRGAGSAAGSETGAMVARRSTARAVARRGPIGRRTGSICGATRRSAT